MDSDDPDYLPDPQRYPAEPEEDEDNHEPDDPGPQEDEDQYVVVAQGKSQTFEHCLKYRN